MPDIKSMNITAAKNDGYLVRMAQEDNCWSPAPLFAGDLTGCLDFIRAEMNDFRNPKTNPEKDAV